MSSHKENIIKKKQITKNMEGSHQTYIKNKKLPTNQIKEVKIFYEKIIQLNTFKQSRIGLICI